MGVESKIKVSRTRALPFFMISMCIFSGPPFLLTCFEFVSDVLHFCVDFRSPFHLNSARFLLLFSRPQKDQKIGLYVELSRGHLWHITDKGGTGRHLGQRMPRRGSEGNCLKTFTFFCQKVARPTVSRAWERPDPHQVHSLRIKVGERPGRAGDLPKHSGVSLPSRQKLLSAQAGTVC